MRDRQPRWPGVWKSAIVQNALALYAIQGASFLLPLVVLPYLARVLSPDGWGLVVFAQAFGVWVSLVIHYGFPFSGTRAVAQNRLEPSRLADIVGGVQSAKLLLCAVAALLAGAAYLSAPIFRAHPAYLLWAWVAAVFQGFSPVWFFQGVERLRGPALLDVVAKMVATAGVFLLVRSPSQGWIVLALRAATEFLATAVLTLWLYRSVALRPFRWSAAAAGLREGWSLFVFTSVASLYTTANSFVLGLMALPREVSFYGAAERVVRAASMLLAPLSQALYPRISHLVSHDRERASALVRRSLLPFMALGAAMGGILALSAPVLVRVVLGPDYAPVVPVIRVLSLIPLLLGVGTVLGLQWALPLGMDRLYNRFVIGAGILNLALAVLLVPRFGAMGMASAAVAAEAFVEAGLVWLAWRHWRRRAKWKRGTDPAAAAAPLHPPVPQQAER